MKNNLDCVPLAAGLGDERIADTFAVVLVLVQQNLLRQDFL